ncbi:MAG: hypothetical protein CM1200mP40_28630 [Gammaproteobacteria bacterium]|nr:MAG: hypothetical protein CM1200mP40_28630 [Gammaproteobacteria bacterium]
MASFSAWTFIRSKELSSIVLRSADILVTSIDNDGAMEIAKRSRGTPRIANRLLRRVRDYSEVKSDGSIDLDRPSSALDMLSIDKNGFDHMDRRLLMTMIEKFGGGPVGIDSLAAPLAKNGIR